MITLSAAVAGLPVGLEVVGHFGDNAHAARVAQALEQEWGGKTADRLAGG